MDTSPLKVKKTLSKSSTKNSLTPCRRVGLGRPSSGSLNKSMQLRTINTPPDIPSHTTNRNDLSAVAHNEKNTSASDSTTLSAPLKQTGGQNKALTKVRRCLAKVTRTNSPVENTGQENEIETDSALKQTKFKFGYSSDYQDIIHVKKLKTSLSMSLAKKKSPKEKDEIENIVYHTTKTKEDIPMLGQNAEVSEKTIVQLTLCLLEKKKKLDQLKVQEMYTKKHNLAELRAQSDRWRAAGQEALRHCVALGRQVGYPVTTLELMERHGFPQDLMGYSADDDDFK